MAYTTCANKREKDDGLCNSIGCEARAVSAIVRKMFNLRKCVENNFDGVGIHIDVADSCNSALLLSSQEMFRIDNTSRLYMKIQRRACART